MVTRAGNVPQVQLPAALSSVANQTLSSVANQTKHHKCLFIFASASKKWRTPITISALKVGANSHSEEKAKKFNQCVQWRKETQPMQCEEHSLNTSYLKRSGRIWHTKRYHIVLQSHMQPVRSLAKCLLYLSVDIYQISDIRYQMSDVRYQKYKSVELGNLRYSQ